MIKVIPASSMARPVLWIALILFLFLAFVGTWVIVYKP